MNFFLKLVISSLMLIVSSAAVFADWATGPATKYEVTMLKLELCTDAPLTTEFDTTCTGAVVVGTGNKVFDIASVNVGASFGQFISATGLPVGTTFKYAKPTFSRQFKMTGSATLSNPTCHCRTATTSTFQQLGAAKGPYKSEQVGVCEVDAATAASNAEPQVLYMQDIAADNITCENANCSATQVTNYSRTPLSYLNDPLLGKALENPPVGQTYVSAIYEIESPYTVTAVAPKVELAFGTTKGFFADSFTAGGTVCKADLYYPMVRVRITD
jgi:hypothetical protein